MDRMDSGRRAVLQGAVAASALAAAQPAMAQTRRHVAGYDPRLSPSVGALNSWLRRLHNFGPIRATGTPQCRAFEEWLATEFARRGCSIERDQFRLTSWECDVSDCSIEVRTDDGETRKLDVLSYYPFGGSTAGKPAVTGRVLYLGDASGMGPEAGQRIQTALARVPREQLAQSVAVFFMPLAEGGARAPVRYYQERFGHPLSPVVGAPRVASQGGQAAMAAVENLCRGVILCNTDVSNEAARYNYLPFSDQHRKIPGLWIGRDDAHFLYTQSGRASVTMRCDARLTPNARADSLLAVMKGDSDQTVFLTTHTDGPNEVNDNGALGLLGVADYFAKTSRPRTLVFSLPTGHYAGGAIRDAATGSGRAAGTGGVIAKWPHYVERAVGQLALEQLGAMEWADTGFRWGPTGRPTAENWIPTPQVRAVAGRLFLAATAGEDPRWSRAGLVESGQAPGEGGGLRSRGIPGLGLMGSPHYFFRADPKGVIDKLDARVMRNQVNISNKLVLLMSRLTPQQLRGEAPISDRDLFG